MTFQELREAALDFPGTEQVLHFERIGFKVTGKRMFLTYLKKDNTANVFLSVSEQSEFCRLKHKGIYPVTNKWGEKGVTTFELNSVPREIIMEALSSAYEDVRHSGGKSGKK